MTITQGYPWAISKVMGFEKPTWSLSLFNSFEDTVTKISSKSTTNKQVMCVWEHKIIKTRATEIKRAPTRNTGRSVAVGMISRQIAETNPEWFKIGYCAQL